MEYRFMDELKHDTKHGCRAGIWLQGEEEPKRSFAV